jgi:hypothetical protein
MGGIGPFGIHPGIPPHAGGFGLNAQNLGPNVVTARFVRLSSDASLDIGIPPAASDSCSSYFQAPRNNAGLFAGPAQLLDAGNLDLTGPGISMTLAPVSSGLGVLYAAALAAPLEQGAYSVSGGGGPDVSNFGPVEITVPPLVSVTTTLAPGTEVSRAAGLEITWGGGDPDDLVLIHGRAFLIPPGTPTPVVDPMQHRSQAFVCSTTAGTGAFSIPEHILQSLPDGLLSLNVTHMPSAEGLTRFEAAGLDLGGVFRWLDTTTYLDLVLGP